MVSEKMFFGPLGLSLIQKQGGPSPGSTVVHSTMGVFFVEFWSSAGRRISQPGGIPLGILGGAVPSGSPNPTLSNQTMSFSHPFSHFSDLASKIDTRFQTWHT